VKYTASPFPARRMQRVTRQKQAVPDFEAALAELEAIVARLEQGELPLEESLRQFERGVVLTRLCQKALSQAEQKIRVLAKGPEGELREHDFEAADAD
jgi:exodeoxyribonuclease VII small subunit